VLTSTSDMPGAGLLVQDTPRALLPAPLLPTTHPTCLAFALSPEVESSPAQRVQHGLPVPLHFSFIC